MTKKELKAYAGKVFYNLSTRPGSAKLGVEINCLTMYQITSKGTCHYVMEVLPLVANKAQYEAMNDLTDGCFHIGRPSAKTLEKWFVDQLL